MNREEIKNLIPHREPMLLLDEVEIDENNISHGKYAIRGDEFFLQGHFPGFPVVPGVILCEIMAQSCSLLIGKGIIEYVPMYAGIDNMHFKASVYPGDTLEITSRITASKGKMYFVDSEATVKGKTVCKGSISFALIPKDQLLASRK
jgi:3-hydroxyacyl-[acyl-carrier-protein] dehydratase